MHDPIATMMQAVDAQVDKGIQQSEPIPLGELRALLLPVKPEREIRTDAGQYLGEIDSYRGYYRLPSVVPADEPGTVGDFLAQINEALSGKVYTGYKGGDYTYSHSHPLFVAHYGECGGIGVIGVDTSRENYVLLLTGQIDDD